MLICLARNRSVVLKLSYTGSRCATNIVIVIAFYTHSKGPYRVGAIYNKLNVLSTIRPQFVIVSFYARR